MAKKPYDSSVWHRPGRSWKVEHIAAEIFMNSAPWMVFSNVFSTYWDGHDGSVVYQIYHGKIWIEIAVSLLIDAHSPVYFAMALEIVLNRREMERRWFGSAF